MGSFAWLLHHVRKATKVNNEAKSHKFFMFIKTIMRNKITFTLIFENILP
jgi:hypothetical protein